ncbi:hypothetical protein ACXR0O_09805 [Verrucomicrobiota bacterium sgz303538]
MKLNHIITIIAALAVPHFVFAEEDEKPVKFEELPPAVAKAIKDAAGGAELKEITLGDEDGKPAYEAVWTAKGHKHEITVAKDGKVLGLEEVISLEEAPAAVREAITKEAGAGKVTEVEKVTEDGKTFFEAVIKTAKGTEELKLDNAGKVLEREKGDKEEDEKSEKK